MNDERTIPTKSDRDLIDSRRHLGYALSRRHTLDLVPHVANDHCDHGVIPVIPEYGERLAVGSAGSKKQGAGAHSLWTSWAGVQSNDSAHQLRRDQLTGEMARTV
jgi:hypothetical protein